MATEEKEKEDREKNEEYWKERAERKAALDKVLPRPYRPVGKKHVLRYRLENRVIFQE